MQIDQNRPAGDHQDRGSEKKRKNGIFLSQPKAKPNK